MNMKSLFLTSIAALVLAGCSSTPPIEKPGSGNKDDDQKREREADAPVQAAPGAPEIIASVRQVFEAKCVGCHGNKQDYGDIANIFDVEELRNKNLIGANADGSALFTKIKDGKHPKDGSVNPVTKKKIEQPSTLEIDFVRQWLDAGAPSLTGKRVRRDIGSFIDAFRADLSSFSRAAQNDIFYVSFHVEYNNNAYNDAELNAAVNAVLKLFNQLDPRSNSPSTIGDGFAVVYDDNQIPMGVRVEFKRIGLLAEDIDLIARISNRDDNLAPLDCAVRALPLKDVIRAAASDDNFDPKNNEFNGGYSNIVLLKLLQDAGFAQAGDLVFNTTSEAAFLANGATLVSNFNNLQILAAIDPTNLNAASLNQLYNVNPDNEIITRACTNQSNVSAANRCIDNFNFSNGGIGFQSYDVLSFNSANGDKDFAAKGFFGPAGLVNAVGGATPFNIDGGEFIGQLNNGSLAFTVYNNVFTLVSNPPTLAVLNPNNPERGSAISVQACSSCHAGLTIPINNNIDVVLDNAINGFDSTTIGFITKIKADQEDLDIAYQIASQNYLETLRRIYVSRAESGELADGIWAFAAAYDNDLTLDEVSANIGTSPELLLDLINNDVDLSRKLAALFAGTISRENFTLAYEDLLKVSSSNDTFLKGCLNEELSSNLRRLATRFGKKTRQRFGRAR